jgi:ribonuclease T2
MRRIVVFSIAAVITAATGFARHHHSHSGDGNGGNQPKGRAGEFDYYVLSLSWSPEFCSNHHDPEQCQGTRKYTFVVHGLWPQYEKGWPQFCQPSSPVPADLAGSMLDLMPNRQLIQHEWDKHGTCSGLKQKGYFDLIRQVREGINIPKDYAQPLKQVTQTPSQIKQHFEAANAGFGKDAIRLACSGRFLSEVDMCLGKDLKSRTCAPDVRDKCSASKVILRPVR